MAALVVSRLATLAPPNVALRVSRLATSGTSTQFSIVAISSTGSISGSRVARVTATADITANAAFFSQTVAVNASLPVSVQGSVKQANATGPARVRLSVLCFDSTETFISSAGEVQIATTGGGFNTGVLNGLTLPAGTASIQFAWFPVLPAYPWVNGGAVDIDACMVEQAATTGAYFDGSTAGTDVLTYAWTGNVQVSASTQSTLTVAGWAADGPLPQRVAVTDGYATRF